MKTPYIWCMFQLWYLWLGFAWKMPGKSEPTLVSQMVFFHAKKLHGTTTTWEKKHLKQTHRIHGNGIFTYMSHWMWPFFTMEHLRNLQKTYPKRIQAPPALDWLESNERMESWSCRVKKNHVSELDQCFCTWMSPDALMEVRING